MNPALANETPLITDIAVMNRDGGGGNMNLSSIDMFIAMCVRVFDYVDCICGGVLDGGWNGQKCVWGDTLFAKVVE